MSEYQYYEFQTFDRPLTEKERHEISKLSSRVELSSTRAVFSYNYSDFPANPEEVLLKYFDAMIYTANWGSRHLRFRLPKNLINAEAIKKYCCLEPLELVEKKDYLILSFCFDEEPETFSLEHENLDALIGLREDILNQDYRALYMVWLKAISLEFGFERDVKDNELVEPPVPAGLRELTPNLMALIKYFEIDKDLISVAAAVSEDKKEKSFDLGETLEKLSREECNDYLLRLLSGEHHLSVFLNKRLQEIAGVEQNTRSKQRSVKELIAELRFEKERVRKVKADERRKKHIEEMEDLARQKSSLWKKVDSLIIEASTKTYNEALKILLELNKLAEFQNEKPVFKQKIQDLKTRYPKKSGLLDRLKSAKLL